MGQIRSSRMLNLITFALAFDFQGMNCEVASPCVPCSVGLVSTECAKSQWVQKLSCISSPSLILFEVDSEVVDEGDHLQQLDQDPQENLLDSSNSNNEDTVFVYQSCSPPNGMRDLIAFEVVMVVGVLWFGLRVAQRKRIRVKHRWS
eukprot:c2552_g1_i1.p1 GENE.c2552_g1_i1~~c2552_g1_i1.p1  ORF type:complete len:147 (-),score=43.91 c2552_g1_i1:118-558(-)